MAKDPKEEKVSFKNELAQLMGLRKLTTSAVYGSDEDFLAQSKKDNSDIRTAINRASTRIKNAVGGDIVDFFSAVSLRKLTSAVDEKGNNLEGDIKPRTLIDIQKLVEQSNTKGLNQLLAQEQDRLSLYFDYRRIKDMIPQMSQAAETYVDNILSPDDLTKMSLTFGYDGDDLNEYDQEKLQNDLALIIKKYDIEKRARKIIRSSIIDGDYFLGIIPLKKELTRFLNESTKEANGRDPFDDASKDFENPKNSALYRQNDVSPSEILHEIMRTVSLDEKKILSESNMEEVEKKEKTEEFKEIRKFLSESVTKTTDFINDNVLVAIDSSVMLSEAISNASDIVGSEPGTFNREVESNGQISQKMFYSPDGQKDNKKDIKLPNIVGSVLRVLQPEMTVKLDVDDVCYGYLYFEPVNEAYSSADILYKDNIESDTVFDNVVASKGRSRSDLAKRSFVTKMFVSGIAKKINKPFLAKNTQFSSIVYNLLRMDYITKKQVRIIYLAPDECVHFGDDNGEGVYYDSIFRSIMFSAKLYIAVLTSTLMYKLVRAPSKRINLWSHRLVTVC
jgi:hypothetical protein